MSWWVWVLVAWVVLAAVAAVVIGLGIRAADRRELGGDRPDEPPAREDEDGA